MDTPITCISFSPNWFYPSIVVLSDQYLAYGANDQVFIFNFRKREFLSQINLSAKVTLLHFQNHILFVAAEGGVLNIYDVVGNEAHFKAKIELNMNIICNLKKFNDSYILFDERGVGLNIKINQQYHLANFHLQFLNQPVDQVKWFTESMVIYQKGNIYTQKKQYDYPNKILYVDSIPFFMAMLVKPSVNQLALHTITYQNEEDLFEKLKWPIEQFTSEVKFFSLRMVANPKLPDENIAKASLSLAILSKNRVLISSRQGEFFIVSWSDDTTPDLEIKMDPQGDNQNVVKIPSESHYKGVFLLQQYQFNTERLFVSVGLDRRINIFSLEEADIDVKWKLSLFGSRVSKIKQAPLEKNLMFFIGPEIGLRSLDLSKKHDPCYQNEYWKGLELMQIDNFSPHPKKEGIFALIGQKKLIIYDAYKEVQICSVNFQDPIAQVKWLSLAEFEQIIAIVDILQKNYGSVLNQQQKQEISIMRTDQKYLKQQQSHQLEYIWVIQSTGKFCMLELEHFKIVAENSFLQAFQIKNLIQDKYNSIPELVTVRTQNIRSDLVANKLNIVLNYNTNSLINISLEVGTKKPIIDLMNLHGQQITCLVTKQYNNEILLCTGSLDRNIYITMIRNNSLVVLGFLRHKYAIESLKINDSFHIMAVAKAHSSVQIWDIEGELERKKHQTEPTREPKEGLERCNIRGHVGFVCDSEFYGKDVALTCSDDQTLKVWNLATILNKKPPNKKKNKNKKKKNKKVKLNSGQEQKLEADSESNEDDDNEQ